MSFLGNIIWHVFGGLLAGLSYILGGFVLCLTNLGIPRTPRHFKLLPVALFPFSYRLTPMRT